MIRSSTGGRIVALVAILLCAPLARGQETARAHFERANASFALGEYGDAAKEYEAAFKLKPDPALLFNAAQSHRLAGNKPRALLLYQNYLRFAGAQAPNREAVETQIETLKQAIENDHRVATSPPTNTAPLAAPPAAQEAPPSPPQRVAPAALVMTPTPSDEPRPLVKRPLFWGVLVGAVVVVAAAIGLGVAFGGPSDPVPSYGTITTRTF